MPSRCGWCGRFLARRDSFVTRWIGLGYIGDVLAWRCFGHTLCPDCRASALVPTPWHRVGPVAQKKEV